MLNERVVVRRWAGIYVGSLGFASNKHFLERYQLQPPES
jgi:hypothetical protein